MYIVEASACFQQRPASRPPPSPVVPSSRSSEPTSRSQPAMRPPLSLCARCLSLHSSFGPRILRGGEYCGNCQFLQLLQLLPAVIRVGNDSVKNDRSPDAHIIPQTPSTPPCLRVRTR